MFSQAVFSFFAALAGASAILMVTRRNIIHGAVFLITTLLATAGIFLQLDAACPVQSPAFCGWHAGVGVGRAGFPGAQGRARGDATCHPVPYVAKKHGS